MAWLKCVKIFNNNQLGDKRKSCFVACKTDSDGIALIFTDNADGSENTPLVVDITKPTRVDLTSKKLMLIDDKISIYLKFFSLDDKLLFLDHLHTITTKIPSNFDARTYSYSAENYFQFYSYLFQQQNMLSDRIRTETYRFAILHNPSDFKNKIVLDVGTGSGVLAFFAVFAGAEKVYAVEASSIAAHAKKLIEFNHFSDKIVLINQKIEDIHDLPMVDTIVSEPIGYMLFNERMLESYIHSRKFLKPNGSMYPSAADFHVCPFSDQAAYSDIFNKGVFWTQRSFYGIDLQSLCEDAHKENFSQPVVDSFNKAILVANPQTVQYDFRTLNESDLYTINQEFVFPIMQNTIINGLAFWFTVIFIGTEKTVCLSTSPEHHLTHWYQVRLFFHIPLTVQIGQNFEVSMKMVANKKQSYDIDLNAHIQGTNMYTADRYDLKNCYFKYFSTTGNMANFQPLVYENQTNCAQPNGHLNEAG